MSPIKVWIYANFVHICIDNQQLLVKAGKGCSFIYSIALDHTFNQPFWLLWCGQWKRQYCMERKKGGFQFKMAVPCFHYTKDSFWQLLSKNKTKISACISCLPILLKLAIDILLSFSGVKWPKNRFFCPKLMPDPRQVHCQYLIFS